jgi:hypothetical protein
VVTGKVADVKPDGTFTEAGTVATEVLDESRETEAPPAGAAPLRVTVPVVGLPPRTGEGLKLTE